MNKFIVITVLLFSMYSSKNNHKIESAIDYKGIVIENPEYTMHIDIEQAENNQANLVVKMELKNGSHFISPNYKGNASGKFYMDLGDYTAIDFKGNLLEFPKSKLVAGPEGFGNSKANWVTTNTSYTQTINIKSKEDFEVFGRVMFVIEPKCTLETTTFGIVSKNGRLTITSPKC